MQVLNRLFIKYDYKWVILPYAYQGKLAIKFT